MMDIFPPYWLGRCAPGGCRTTCRRSPWGKWTFSRRGCFRLQSLRSSGPGFIVLCLIGGRKFPAPRLQGLARKCQGWGDATKDKE